MIVVMLFAILWQLLGITQGILWSREGEDSFEWNEHVIFVLTAVFAVMAFVLGFVFEGTERDIVLLIIAIILIYPFFYNGAYYEVRKRIAKGNNQIVYPRGWFSDPSTTSTATINLSNKVRNVLLILGLGVLSIYYVW